MAADNLLVEIHPSLLEAMKLPSEGGRLDYFEILNLNREKFTDAEIDKAVLTHSKALRPWQNSPQHGAEVVKLLPLFHRVAAILKDNARRNAYVQELDRLRSGAKRDPVEEFRDMVRAALADGVIDQASKTELLRFATKNNIPTAEAGRILNELTAGAPAVPRRRESGDESWEFKIAGAASGPDAFRDAVTAVIETGGFSPETRERMLADASKFQVDDASASKIMTALTQKRFKELAEIVARNGVLNDNQARLLMPKATNLGLTTKEAYEILSDYTFTGASQEDIATLQLTVAGFDSTEIDSLLSHQSTVLYKAKWNPFAGLTAAGLMKTIVGLAAIGGVVWGASLFFAPAPTVRYDADPSTNPGGSADDTPVANPWEHPKPDPKTGILLVDPMQDGDPNPFRIKITEVTCSEYKNFLTDTFHPRRPTGWGIDYSFPEGSANKPVTGITWQDAADFCAWYARKNNLPEEKVRLPRITEFKRIMRAPGKDGILGTDETIWEALKLHETSELSNVMESKVTDVLFLSNGQIYDLLSNASEWGWDDQAGKKVLFGGDVSQSDAAFNPNQLSWHEPNEVIPYAGFRYLIEGQP